MYYFNCKIQVLINDQIINNIVSVDTKNDGHQIGATCDIVMPLNSRIYFNNSGSDLSPALPNRYLFNTGDHIIVRALYEGYESHGNDGIWVKLFDGFLYDFYETTPVKIHCVDYIYWFNIGTYGADYVTTKKLTKTGKVQKGSIKGGEGKQWKSIQFADLLQDIVDWVNDQIDGWNEENGTTISNVELIRPNLDFNLVDISFINMSAAAVLEWLKRELGFNISLMDNKLYANVASFTNNTVKLSTDVNVLESNLQSTNLTKRHEQSCKGANSVFLRLKVKAYFEKDNGTRDSVEVGDPNGKLVECYFYKVSKGTLVEYPTGSGQMVPENYIKFANEALNQAYQKRYTGTVDTLLYPVINLFDKVTYNDIRYPDRNGDYVATAIDVSLSDRGFHRKIKMAFLTNYNIVTTANQ